MTQRTDRGLLVTFQRIYTKHVTYAMHVRLLYGHCSQPVHMQPCTHSQRTDTYADIYSLGSSMLRSPRSLNSRPCKQPQNCSHAPCCCWEQCGGQLAAAPGNCSYCGTDICTCITTVQRLHGCSITQNLSDLQCCCRCLLSLFLLLLAMSTTLLLT